MGAVEFTRREIDKLDQMQCLDEANRSKIVSELDKRVSDLAANWNPTGFYTADEIERLVKQVISTFPQAKTALLTAPRSTSTADGDIGNAVLALDKRLESGMAYLAAARKARETGTRAIDAPGLKRWVLFGMNDIAHAYTVVSVLQCRVTWLETALGLIVTVWNTAKSIAGIVVSAAEATIDAAEGIWKARRYIKWGFLVLAVIVAGTFAVRWINRMQQSLDTGEGQ